MRNIQLSNKCMVRIHSLIEILTLCTEFNTIEDINMNYIHTHAHKKLNF